MHMVALKSLLERLEEKPSFSAALTRKHVIEGSPGSTAEIPTEIHPRLRAYLSEKGIDTLYSHQGDAWRKTAEGHNICLATPTASGKSLCYHLPVLNRILNTPDARALFLFPTKALAQDQYKAVHDMITAMEAGIKTFTYDGDTPQNARQAIRQHGHIVISNPDMIHTGILPHHTKWTKLFENLQFIVLDEIHAYRGVFGSHLCNIIRRLKRIARFHGSSPQFICCSATIANPTEFAERLIEEPVHLIDESGAPTGNRTVYFYNPPVINQELGIRASYIKRARNLATEMIRHDVPTIVFALSRLNVEILLKYTREALKKAHKSPEILQGYRGGYLPLKRRAIEAGLRSGKVQGVIATNALELGIDIGQLSACVVAGYPGTVASLWQQSGRAGRRNDDSVTFFVARSNPLDQFIVQNPDYFFGQSPEHARLNGDNLYILMEHIKCAAFELPFTRGDSYGGMSADETEAALQYLAEHRLVHQSEGRFHWSSAHFPANDVNIRNIPGENFIVADSESGETLAEVDYRSTQTTLHEHAIYNLDGQQYQVERLDWENHKAYVKKVQVDFFTDAMTYNKVSVLSVDESRAADTIVVEHGDVNVIEKVVGFKKVRFYTGENVGFGEVVLPELTMHTSAYWFTIPHTALRPLEADKAALVDSLLGISHAMYYVAVMALMCDTQDLGRCVGDKSARWYATIPPGAGGRYSTHPTPMLEANAPLEEVFDPTLFLYDSFPGGVGFSEKLYQHHHQLLSSAYDLISACACEQGCPSCVGPLLHFNERSKELPLSILKNVLGVGSGSTTHRPETAENRPVPEQLYDEQERQFQHPPYTR